MQRKGRTSNGTVFREDGTQKRRRTWWTGPHDAPQILALMAVKRRQVLPYPTSRAKSVGCATASCRIARDA
jgi:hypothetical protein